MTSAEFSPMRTQATPLITKVGVAGVAVSMLTVAGANVVGWLNTLPGLAGAAAASLAFGFELMAFVLLEHIFAYWKARDGLRIFLAVIGLALCVGVNIEGGHRGINYMAAPLHIDANAAREQAQQALDEARVSFWANNIAPIRERIASVTPPDLSGGPLNDASENHRWETATAEDRASLATNMQRYDDMSIVAPAVEPYPWFGPYLLAAVFVFFSVFGLTMFGVKVPGADLVVRAPTPRRKKRDVSPQGENVIDLGTARDTKRDAETVLRLHKAGYSVRRIAAETGISKSRAQRLLAAQ